jgi:AcrR family transcriptional regulator
MAALTDHGVDHVKVLPLARELGVSRSSFYWYFDDRQHLHDDLLGIWDSNTHSIIERTARAAPTITAAVLGVFECWADEYLFDSRLDIAVRDWARGDAAVKLRVDAADAARIDGISVMFMAYGYADDDSLVRARLLYHSQVGYYAVGTSESMDVRVGYLPYYLRALTGFEPCSDELAGFVDFIGLVDR